MQQARLDRMGKFLLIYGKNESMIAKMKSNTMMWLKI